MLKILTEHGEEMFEVKLGQRVPPDELQRAMDYPCYAKATGLELDECRRIMGRPLACRTSSHTYDCDATEEILLNWGL